MEFVAADIAVDAGKCKYATCIVCICKLRFVYHLAAYLKEELVRKFQNKKLSVIQEVLSLLLHAGHATAKAQNLMMYMANPN